MDLTPIKVAAMILNHRRVPICTVGELALNYYNVPRVCHLLEICVPKFSSILAAGLLCATGLFEPGEMDRDFNNYTEYRRNIPRVRTTSWCSPQTILIFTSAFFGFDSMDDVLIPPTVKGEQNLYISKEIRLNQDDIPSLHFPRLGPLLKGLATRFLDTRDDVAMMAVEQLVDGMDLDEAWVEKQLGGCSATVIDLVIGRVRGKKSRIDYYMENKITCFVFDEEEAEKVRLIPGYE